jgi:hypothetical protein
VTAQRHITLRLECQIVALPGDPEVLSYAGIAVGRIENHRVVDYVWVPMGDDPSEADDEALLLAWRAAACWSIEPAR